MATNTVISNIYNEEYMDIKFVGKNKFNFICPPMPKENWTFTPSGRIGAHYRTFQEKLYDCYIFTFVDLVEKICFEIQLKYRTKGEDKVDCFYFTAEDKMIIISGVDDYIKQLVYKIDYNERKLELQEEILHEFTERDENDQFVPGSLTSHHANFVSFDRIDYAVLVSYAHYSNDLQSSIYAIYLVPKDPIKINVPMKEFQMHLKDADLVQLKEKVNAKFTYPQDRTNVTVDESSCVMNETKLVFSCRLDRDIGTRKPKLLGRLVGAYWEVDLANLKDIYQATTIQECKQLVDNQGNVGEFVHRGDLRISDWFYLQCYEKDVGMVTIIDNKLKQYEQYGASSALLFPPNIVDGAQPITLNSRIESEAVEHRYALHPHGALLHFSFPEGYFIRLRVLRCLKPNLMFLAFNRALFHKNTPIKIHPVNRLCFKSTFKYNNCSPKRSLERKLPKA